MKARGLLGAWMRLWLHEESWFRTVAWKWGWCWWGSARYMAAGEKMTPRGDHRCCLSGACEGQLGSRNSGHMLGFVDGLWVFNNVMWVYNIDG
ncbi:hypothetical protein V6N13_064439 [Hibiscus sabdariffa]